MLDREVCLSFLFSSSTTQEKAKSVVFDDLFVRLLLITCALGLTLTVTVTVTLLLAVQIHSTLLLD